METLLAWDRSVMLWVNSHNNALLDAILAPVSLAGEYAAIWILACLVMMIAGKPAHRSAGLVLLLTLLLVHQLVASPIGHYFDRQRPYLVIEEVRQFGVRWTSSSFPSGHSFTVWTSAVILSSRFRRLLVPLVVFAVLTCYSRLYFGMHYPSDVIGGSILGIAAGLTVIAAQRFLEKRDQMETA